MRSLRDLLSTWETWSVGRTYRDTLTSARTPEQRQVILDALAESPEVAPLDALADVTELVSLLVGWRWQAVFAARVEGASWEQIGTATGTSGEQARADYLDAVEAQALYRPDAMTTYRDVL